MKVSKIAFIPNADWYCALRCAEEETLATIAKKTGAAKAEFHREIVKCECRKYCPVDNEREVAHVVITSPILSRIEVAKRFAPRGFVICPVWAWEEDEVMVNINLDEVFPLQAD